MELEIWKPIKGYENDYEVSNMGNVRKNNGSDKNGGGIKNLKLTLTNNGYYVVNLYNEGKAKTHLVHKLVAEAFIPNPYNLPVIDHFNTITTDNKVENLYWCSRKDIVNNSVSCQRGYDKCRALLKGKYGKDSRAHKSVLQYTLDGVFVETWDCMKDACRELGISMSCLIRACKGIQKTAGGYIWKYKQ